MLDVGLQAIATYSQPSAGVSKSFHDVSESGIVRVARRSNRDHVGIQRQRRGFGLRRDSSLERRTRSYASIRWILGRVFRQKYNLLQR